MNGFDRDVGRTVRPLTRPELLAGGVQVRELAGWRWKQLSHGWHLPAGVEVTPAQRIVQAVGMVPRGSVGGWAAAYVLGAELLDGLDPFTGVEQAVPMVLPPDASHRSRPGVRGIRARLDPGDVVVSHGLRVTSPLRTAVDLARDAASLTEAVVALDVLLAAGVVELDAVVSAVGSVSDLRGSRQARAANALCRLGVLSPWETRLRMLVHDLGLPEPLVNQPVFDLRGRFLGTPDLLDLDAGLALEFDGSEHRERGQHREDNVREEGLEHGGLVVVRADSLDLTRHRSQLVRRIREGRFDALTDPRPRGFTIEQPTWWRGLPA